MNISALTLQERIQEVESRVNAACRRSGRRREDVQVVAVTKRVSAAVTEEIIKQGFLHIGENRWQDATGKWNLLGSHGIWHFIGRLQTNKVKYVVGKFAYIHSLDRLSLAEEIEKRCVQTVQETQCFIQVNVSGEHSKFGLAPPQLFPFVEQLLPYKHLRIMGLMTMAPHEMDPQRTRPVFQKLRILKEQLNTEGILPYPLLHLSMGMSNDFEVAIEEGATWVRLGTVLVG